MPSDANSTATLYRKTLMCRITSGQISTLPKITEIAFGSGGVDANGDPKQPVYTMTALFHQVAQYPIDSVTYPTPTTARYTAHLPAHALAGVNINEVALYDASGQMCAIKTMYNKQKDADVTFTITLDDEF